MSHALVYVPRCPGAGACVWYGSGAAMVGVVSLKRWLVVEEIFDMLPPSEGRPKEQLWHNLDIFFPVNFIIFFYENTTVLITR